MYITIYNDIIYNNIIHKKYMFYIIYYILYILCIIIYIYMILFNTMYSCEHRYHFGFSNMIYTPNIQFYVVKTKNLGTPPSSLVFVCGVTHVQSNPIEISTISRWFFSVDHRPLIPRVSRSKTIGPSQWWDPFEGDRSYTFRIHHFCAQL